jgi:TusA-related sulfurtransferase
MSNVSTLDLEAHRCPAAMIMARRAIEAFYQDAQPGSKLLIQTIEPSFKRDLSAFIHSEYESITLVKNISGEIDQTTKNKWELKFDEDDWKGTVQSCYVLEKHESGTDK